MGADFIGYIIVDRFLVPPGEEIHYAEACVFMPGSYQVNDSRRPVAADGGRRAEHGLPEDGVVFCCFNQQAKITPEVFAVWMRVLAQVPGSVLWLVRFNGDAEQPLRAAASSMGVAPDRLVFAPKIATEAHLARYALADLFLDTFPCNAHTTASDALWGGCPVVTCAGKTFAARVAGSLLTALRMEDLITTSLHDYEALALELALDPRRLREIRSRLAEQRSKSGLFDGAKFARTMEQAYGAMWARHTKGVSPEHMDIRLIESESGGSMP
jgi:predicted O-linked N-acetylglucosamine transferase (SPINDLY family)